ncbi:MAG: hypothetical protein LBD50_02360 [Rickettsiales bacterium]|jgi:hypothetical protein|nr:hypothetical protein [Rickettsiales bacterium]
MISKINPRFIANMMSIVSVAGIAAISSVHAEDTTPAVKVLATEGFVRGGLATKASHSDIATAVNALVPISQKGVADGVASLGSDGKVPTAQLPTIPADTNTAATLKTDNEATQTASSGESLLSGTVNLHKVSKTGSYNDLLNKPVIPDTSSLAADSDVVHKASVANETLAGTYTITGTINVPTQPIPAP